MSHSCLQTCVMCKLPKQPGEYFLNRCSFTGLTHICRDCYTATDQPGWWSDADRELLRVGFKVHCNWCWVFACELHFVDMRKTGPLSQICKTCDDCKALSEFAYDKRINKHNGKCRDCIYLRIKELAGERQASGAMVPIHRVRMFTWLVCHTSQRFLQVRDPGALPLPSHLEPSPYKYTHYYPVQLRYEWRPSFGVNRSTSRRCQSSLLAALAGKAFHRFRRQRVNHAWEAAGVPSDAWGQQGTIDIDRALEGMMANDVGRLHVSMHLQQQVSTICVMQCLWSHPSHTGGTAQLAGQGVRLLQERHRLQLPRRQQKVCIKSTRKLVWSIRVQRSAVPDRAVLDAAGGYACGTSAWWHAPAYHQQ